MEREDGGIESYDELDESDDDDVPQLFDSDEEVSAITLLLHVCLLSFRTF